MMNQAVPICCMENIVFSREEKQGFMTVLVNTNPGLKLLNNTSRYILDLCDGSHSVAQIHDLLRDRFPEEKPHTLLRDLKQTLLILSSESLIKWKGSRNPFSPVETLFEIRIDPLTRVYRATEHDFNEILRVARNAISPDDSTEKGKQVTVIASRLASAGIYQALALRSRMFNYIEWIYFLERDGERIGMLNLMDDFPISRRAVISLLILGHGDRVSESIRCLLKGATADLKKHIKKLKCSLFSNQPQVDIYDICLQEIGFAREGVLRSEYDNGVDEWVYGRLM